MNYKYVLSAIWVHNTSISEISVWQKEKTIIHNKLYELPPFLKEEYNQ